MLKKVFGIIFATLSVIFLYTKLLYFYVAKSTWPYIPLQLLRQRNIRFLFAQKDGTS